MLNGVKHLLRLLSLLYTYRLKKILHYVQDDKVVSFRVCPSGF
jgi:hypothetical protein